MVEVDASVAAAVGYRLRGGLLVENAGALKNLVLGEMPLFKQEKLLDEALVTALDAAVALVLKGVKDRASGASEAHLQTALQATALHDLKAERRRLSESVVRAFRHRPELQQYNQGTYHGTSVAAFCTDLNRKLGFAREHEAALAAVGAGKEFLDALEAKLRAMETDSGVQEAALARLPDDNRAFCVAKGRLFFIMKDIINAARALHNKDPEASAKYNLKILYRKGGSKAKAEAIPSPAPVPAPAT